MLKIPSEWTFRDFLDARGTNPVHAQISSLPQGAQAKLDSLLTTLGAWPSLWPPQYVSRLRGYKGIYELRMVSSGVQYRPLGCYGPSKKDFTLLLISIEKGGKLPKRDCETAVERQRVVIAERERTCEHDFS